MDYIEISSDEEVQSTVNIIREKYSNWRQIVIPSDRETTMRGTEVVVLYIKFAPVCKVEGQAEYLDMFTKQLRRLCEGTNT